MARGNYSIRYNPDQLRQMIEAGKDAKEIMKSLKISKYTLREHLFMLQENDDKVYVINGLFDHPEAEQSSISENVEGIIFPKEMLEKTGFSSGDSFEMIVEEDRIILKRIDSSDE